MEIIGYVDSVNQGDGFLNISVRDKENQVYNIKLESLDDIQMASLYVFDVSKIEKGEKVYYHLNSYTDACIKLELNELEENLKYFYKSAPISIIDVKKEIELYIDKIVNEDIKAITKYIYNDNEKMFYLYPAATKFHHAYIGGLAYHTQSMLELSKSIIDRYSFLSTDLIYAGVILHDICKVVEFNKVYNAEYSVKGQLIGHIVLGAMAVENAAKYLKINSEVVMLLEHIILSHHGQLLYGSPKKPMIAEALVVSFLDNMDSKLTVLDEELHNTKVGDMTTNIGVLDKTKFYKHNF